MRVTSTGAGRRRAVKRKKGKSAIMLKNETGLTFHHTFRHLHRNRLETHLMHNSEFITCLLTFCFFFTFFDCCDKKKKNKRNGKKNAPRDENGKGFAIFLRLSESVERDATPSAKHQMFPVQSERLLPKRGDHPQFSRSPSTLRCRSWTTGATSQNIIRTRSLC